MEKYKNYDVLINKTIINLYTLTKPTKFHVFLKNFNPKNKQHLYMLECALRFSTIQGVDVSVDMPFFPFWFFKLKSKKKIIRNYHPEGVDINSVLAFMSEATGNPVTIFEEIYDEYWSKKSD